MREVTAEKLAVALRAGLAVDDVERRAAVELLAAHDYWLRRHLVLDAVVRESRTQAHLRWWVLAAGVDTTPASSSERAILRLACSLAGHVPAGLDEVQASLWSLKFMLQPLGEANARLAHAAITYAATGAGVIA